MNEIKVCINEKYRQLITSFSSQHRNDIYRKFEPQFISCFRNNINIPDDVYVKHATPEYEKDLNIFMNSHVSDIKFILGYTGVGKSTLLKHYFGYKSTGFEIQNDTILIPSTWDGMLIPENNYEEFIDIQIINIIDNLLNKLNYGYEELIITHSDKIIDYINEEKRTDLITSLSIQEITQCKNSGISLNQAKIQKSKEKNGVALSSALLQYVLEKYRQGIGKLVFIIDDLETLSQKKLCYLVNRFLHIYSCLHNVKSAPVIKLIISLRPHSFRYLRSELPHQQASAYGNLLDNESYRLYKNEIPSIKEILLSRFNDAFKSGNPRNPETWNVAKENFYRLINGFDENIINTISDLCHKNIRAIIDCMHMILSNRIWCQNNTTPNDSFTVRDTDYHFDIVNVVRTLACGECPVYTGTTEIKFNQKNYSNVLARPRFDDSSVFIPNIFIDLDTKECDVLPAIIIQYLEGYFSSDVFSAPQTEFIKKITLCSNLVNIFNNKVSKDKISRIIDYLFENRIVRKSIISSDTDNTIEKLNDEDYIYLTLKGSRLLMMLENDSVLLEIYREDIKRSYRNEVSISSAFELRNNNNRYALFDDLIQLMREIFENECQYQEIIDPNSLVKFYNNKFSIINKLITGVQNSIERAQNIDSCMQKMLKSKIEELSNDVSRRIKEIE